MGILAIVLGSFCLKLAYHEYKESVETEYAWLFGLLGVANVAIGVNGLFNG